MNISGIVVKAAPDHLEEVMGTLRASGLCELHFHDKAGKIIVTVEGRDTNEEIRKMKEIMGLPGVVCASLAYTYNEEEIQGALEEMEGPMHPVPEALRD